MNSAKQAGHLLSPQSSLVIAYANGMYGMLASAHNDSQMLLRNIGESQKEWRHMHKNSAAPRTFNLLV